MSKNQTYFIASDHAGIKTRQFIAELLKSAGVDVVDLGCDNEERVDYPDYASKVCEKVLLTPDSKGVLVCGSGIGMSIAANRHAGIRAALCHDAYTAAAAREHNDANVLCVGERALGLGAVESVVKAWLASSFEGGRHAQRVGKLG